MASPKDMPNFRSREMIEEVAAGDLALQAEMVEFVEALEKAEAEKKSKKPKFKRTDHLTQKPLRGNPELLKLKKELA